MPVISPATDLADGTKSVKSDRAPPTPSDLLLTDEAAEYVRLAKHTLAKWRCAGVGPPFVRLGRKIAYRRADLEKWFEARRASSTTEADQLPKFLTKLSTIEVGRQ